jgi:hypothetical protein
MEVGGIHIRIDISLCKFCGTFSKYLPIVMMKENHEDLQSRRPMFRWNSLPPQDKSKRVPTMPACSALIY